jgi:hypothetical protein
MNKQKFIQVLDRLEKKYKEGTRLGNTYRVLKEEAKLELIQDLSAMLEDIPESANEIPPTHREPEPLHLFLFTDTGDNALSVRLVQAHTPQEAESLLPSLDIDYFDNRRLTAIDNLPVTPSILHGDSLVGEKTMRLFVITDFGDNAMRFNVVRAVDVAMAEAVVPGLDHIFNERQIIEVSAPGETAVLKSATYIEG